MGHVKQSGCHCRRTRQWQGLFVVRNIIQAVEIEERLVSIDSTPATHGVGVGVKEASNCDARLSLACLLGEIRMYEMEDVIVL